MSHASQKQLEEKNKDAKSDGTKAKDKAIVKKITAEDARKLLKNDPPFKAECDPDVIFKKAAEQVRDIASDDKKISFKASKALEEITSKHMMAWGLETHLALAETMEERLRPLVIEVARQIEKEYDCKTTSELVLVDAIAGAYGRVMEYSKQLECCTRVDSLSSVKTGYYAMLSKEVDRAHRHLMTSLAMLKQMKSPTFEVNVKAKTAFIAQNQQINVDNPPKPTNNEINEH